MPNTAYIIAELLAEGLWPIAEVTSRDAANQRTFLLQLGYSVTTPPAALATLSLAAIPLVSALGDLDEIREAMDADAATEQDVNAVFARLFGAAVAVAVTVKTIGNLTTSELPDFENRFYEHLLVNTVSRRHPVLFAVLVALGIFEVTDQQIDDGGRPLVVPRFTFHSDRVELLLRDLSGLLEDVYGWGTPQLDSARLFDNFTRLTTLLGLPPSLEFPTTEMAAAYQVPTPADLSDLTRQLVIPIGSLGDADFALGVYPVPPPTPTDAQPLALTLEVTGESTFSFDLTPNALLELEVKGNVDTGLGLLLRPRQEPSFIANAMGDGGASPLADLSAELRLTVTDATEPKPPGGSGIELLTLNEKSAVRADSIKLAATGRVKQGQTPEILVSFAIEGGKAVLAAAEDDGFLSSVLPKDPMDANFDIGIQWSSATGVHLQLSGGLEIALGIHRTIGPIAIDVLRLAVNASGGLGLDFSIDGSVTLGPFTASVQRLGGRFLLKFERGNLGPVDLTADFLPPNGVGIAIDGGAVHGGGFLSFEDHRYSGAIELSVFAVTVKAFGLIETQLPDGTPGFSFVIIIVAEFTPIQLGFGFTLLGVGGLLGVNRSLNEQGLSDAVRTGSLEHVLFPHDPVHDAPAIIHDLATLFPATKDHFIFGPMAKLGWGTPTLITADLGIVIEFPGPRIAVLGILRMLLPDPDEAIVALNMAVAGLLDFPAKKFSLDASLFDSTVAGYAVTGDMAFRLEFGNNAKFLLSVGGFNTGFSPPAPFPDLRRVSVDFGVNGNPSLTASGYFALTSNTAQIGSSIQLHASGYGITVDGWMGFDVLFVFSPFSLNASISAGMRASFHGHGLGITLHGTLTGPTPWHLNGKVCVSILWWDACLPIDVTFGDGQPASLPEIDPWIGDSSVPVVGLSTAISDPRNWEGTGTPAEVTVVSLAASNRTPIDPLGSATLRQKVAPFNRKLEKFGEFKPKDHDRFNLGPSGGTVGVVVPGQTNPVPVTELKVVQDDFAPGHFMKLSNAQKLSLPSYVPMDAGVSVAADRISLGSSDAKTIAYVTKFIDDDGVAHDDPNKLTLTDAQLRGLLKRSPAALGGVRRTGTERFMLADRPKKIRLGPPLFVVADACTMVRNSAVTGAPISQAEALLALREHLRTNPQDADRFTVVPKYAEAA